MQSIDSVERERTRLAGALHDSPVQNLIAARHDLRRAERAGDPNSFARLHRALDVTIAELREEIFKLHPHVLDHVGLSAAFEQVARRYAGGVRVEIDVALDAEPDEADRQVLFAVGRELLGNAAKHAYANEIRLTLSGDTDGVVLEVADDGRGIAEGRERQALLDGHIGLAAVRERVAALGGVLSVASSPDNGTIVRVAIPLESRRKQAGMHVSDRVTVHDTLRLSPT
jgi:two-component system NarL family sensor kinase